jgi:hypothetical protein
VPLEVVPWELPVDGEEVLDWVELVEPDDVLEVESPVGEPDWVEPVLVEGGVVVGDVVDVVSDPPGAVVAPSAGWLGGASPGLNEVEIPPVGRVVTLTVMVVVVVEAGDVACAAEDVEAGWVAPLGLPASCDCVVGLTAAVEEADAGSLVSAVAAGTYRLAGGKGAVLWVTRAW